MKVSEKSGKIVSMGILAAAVAFMLGGGVKEESIYERASAMYSPTKAIVIETIETVNGIFEEHGIVQDTLWDKNVALVGDTSVFRIDSEALFSGLDRAVVDETQSEELPGEFTSVLRDALLDIQQTKSCYLEPYEDKDCEVTPQEFFDWMGDIAPAWLKVTEGMAENLVIHAYLADVDGDGVVEGIQYVSKGERGGFTQILFWKKKAGEPVLGFRTTVTDHSYGALLSWNGQHYLVFSNCNQYSFVVDSFHIVSFSGQYPKEYTISIESDGKDWQEAYCNEESDAAVMDSLRSYLKELAPRLEECTVLNDDFQIMYGQAEIPMAKAKERFHNFENWKTYCVVADIDNDGAKERVEKVICYPDSVNSRPYLMTGFLKQYQTLVYRLDLVFPENYVEGVDLDLIQLWFDEIEGKVYTFQMLRFNESNDYMLNVSLLQGDELTPMFQYLLIDRKVILSKGSLELEEVYDLVEQGDLSVVEADEYSMSQLEIMSQKISEGRDTYFDWKRADINGDGVPELINYDNRSDSREEPIYYIFTYDRGRAILVYMDVVDMTEYYFLGDNGNMIYSNENFGLADIGFYLWSRFEKNPEGRLENWIKYGQERLIIQFYDEWLLEEYPEYFENIEPGIYYYRETPTTQAQLWEQYEWVREQISKEEFLRAYKEMTGFDFLTENSDWVYRWEKVFE